MATSIIIIQMLLLNILLTVFFKMLVYSCRPSLDPEEIFSPPQRYLSKCSDMFDFHNRRVRVLLASGGETPEMLFNILHGTREAPTTRNYLAQGVNRTQFKQHCSRPAFFLLLEPGNPRDIRI